MTRSWPLVLCIAALAGCASTTDRNSSPGGPPPAPPALEASGELTHIGFGSCLDQERPQPILDRIVDEDFDLFLFLGDNVYGDVERDRPRDMTPLEEAYALQSRSAGLRKLRGTTPILVTWDDHDYGLNDAGADFPGREGAESLFEEFWEIPAGAASAQRPGVYDSVVLGPPGRRVQILLLDTRFFRSPLKPTDEKGALGKERYMPDPDPAKTMLGEAQWSWLEGELRKPAELRLLVSSIQVIAEGHGWEAWRTLPAQRQRLYTTLRESKAQGLIVLSGDRHRAGLYVQEEALDYPLYELTSSSLNLPIEGIKEEPGPRRLGPTYWKENYGAIDIDWSDGTVVLKVVALKARGLEGRTVIEKTLALDLLRGAR